MLTRSRRPTRPLIAILVPASATWKTTRMKAFCIGSSGAM